MLPCIEGGLEGQGLSHWTNTSMSQGLQSGGLLGTEIEKEQLELEKAGQAESQGVDGQRLVCSQRT